MKLSHEIESKILEGRVNSEFISSTMSQYDNIVESIDEDIPSHICARVRNEYKTKKWLPTIINGIPKESPSSSLTSPKLSPLKRVSVSLVNVV